MIKHLDQFGKGAKTLMSKYKILVICSSLGVGGAEIQLAKLLTRINKEKYSIKVAYFMPVTDFPKKILEEGGIETVFLGSPLWSKISYFFDAIKYLYREKFDLVHCWLHTVNFYGTIPAFLNRVPAIVGGLQGNVELEKPWNYVYKIMKYMIDDWIVNSSSLKKNLIDNVGVENKFIHIVRNGIEIPSGDRDSNAILSGANRQLVVGFAGRLQPVKNPFLFLYVASKIIAKYSQVRFLIAGEGPLRGDIDKFVVNHKLVDNVEVLGKLTDMHKFYENLDLLILTSDSESCPNVLLEAMAHSLPVISTKCTDLSNVVFHETNGFLVEKGDVVEICDCLERLINNGDLRKKMGIASRDIVEKNFEIQLAVDELEKCYQYIIDKS